MNRDTAPIGSERKPAPEVSMPLAREGATAGEQDQTVLLSSHALGEVHRLADSIGLLHEGLLLLHGGIEDLLDHTKRIRAVREDEAADGRPPPGMVFQQVNGREGVMTLENFDRSHLKFVRARNRVSHVDVQDLSLDDLFKDFVRGRCRGGALRP
jgi:ABC-2 type transport system ATP-binding protein